MVNVLLTIIYRCPFADYCRGCWLILPFCFRLFSAKTFCGSTQLRGFLCALFSLRCPPSSGSPEVLRVSFRGQFDVKNRLPLSTFRLLSSLLN
jgi:hypothetical protein